MTILNARWSLLWATIVTGLYAGFFFTYEASVTIALSDVGDTTYVETFQAINDTVQNPAFGLVFFGSIPAIAVALAVNWTTIGRVPRVAMVAALVLYLAGVMVTGAGNVPLNETLASIDVTSPAVATAARADFEDDWNRLNLLRSVLIGASFIALATASLVVSPAAKRASRPVVGHAG